MFNRLVIIFGGSFVSLWFFVHMYSYFWGKKKLTRTFKEVDRSNIKDCIDGEVVRIQGKLVFLAQFLAAPLSQRKCSAYTLRASIEVDRVTTSGTGSHVATETAWETLRYVELTQSFLIRCGEYYALVKPENAKLVIHSDAVHDDNTYEKDKGGFLTEAENEKRKLTLEAIGISSKQYTGVYGRNIKFEEGVLEPDEQVAVLGAGKWVNTLGTIENEYLAQLGIERVFEIEQTEGQRLYISDSKHLLEDFK